MNLVRLSTLPNSENGRRLDFLQARGDLNQQTLGRLREILSFSAGLEGE
jgi:hypothetical protein